MRLDELIATLKRTGCEIVFGEDGEPRLRGPKECQTPRILNLLKLRREEIKATLGPEPPPPPKPVREWLWRYGQTITECPSWGWAEDKHATGAFWWRWKGETEWRAVPGRNLESLAPPIAAS